MLKNVVCLKLWNLETTHLLYTFTSLAPIHSPFYGNFGEVRMTGEGYIGCLKSIKAKFLSLAQEVLDIQRLFMLLELI